MRFECQIKRHTASHRILYFIILQLLLHSAMAELKLVKLPESIHKKTQQLNRNYLIYTPAKIEQPSPLLIFLHGRGECGEDIELVTRHGPPKLIKKGMNLPFIVLAPQCKLNSKGKGRWNVSDLNVLLEQVIKEHDIDEDRIYLTGISMGGYGTWAWATKRPDLFAALVPICGGGNPKQAAQIAHLPIRVFHGQKDKKVAVGKSKEMVEALRKHNSSVEINIYPDLQHDSWTRTYDQPELFEWFAKQKRLKK